MDKEHEKVTFEQNMQQLYQIKEQLLKLNHIYSPNSVNYHQLSLIEKLRQQINNSKNTIQNTQTNLMQKNRSLQFELQQLIKQKQQLEEVNMQLVQNNQKMINKFQQTHKQLQQAHKLLQDEKQQNTKIHEKYRKQIQNIKLIHNQELYILRKRQKKNHN